MSKLIDSNAFSTSASEQLQGEAVAREHGLLTLESKVQTQSDNSAARETNPVSSTLADLNTTKTYLHQQSPMINHCHQCHTLY